MSGPDRPRVLQRVEDDLARGHTYAAIQRLSTLVNSDPTDLRLRERLAAVYLQTGNLPQAGRWGYFSEQRDAAATTAFERAFADPQIRLSALRWPHGAEHDAPPQVRDRLAEVRSVVWQGRSLGSASEWHPTLGNRLGLLAWASVALAVPVLAVIGLVTVLRWIW